MVHRKQLIGVYEEYAAWLMRQRQPKTRDKKHDRSTESVADVIKRVVDEYLSRRGEHL